MAFLLTSEAALAAFPRPFPLIEEFILIQIYSFKWVDVYWLERYEGIEKDERARGILDEVGVVKSIKDW